MVLALAWLGGGLAASAGTVEADTSAAMQTLDSLYSHLDAGQPVDWTRDQAQFVAFGNDHPDADAASLVKNLMYGYEMTHSVADSQKAWSAFEGSANKAVAEAARSKAAFFALAHAPVDLSFTGLDGKPVDLAGLRGKVVLLDFWATWCPPCMQELPNVRQVYSKYHARGFEIVGISCDVDPANAKGKIASWMKTGPQVLAFTEANGMPWPQNYEGRKHNAGGNTIAARFAVTGIPAAFLIGKDGRIQAMNLRGERLDEAVKGLLAN